ncbi:unnamed protein product [Soboliphyme baturini]|uniref:LRRNT domain-containing protein n=1 Tax=Soboliphyme baturini TaxID=241478 RepID=A0A183J1X9_9BILA|nr:unnamed protein product [Soboliphyme baturini]
MPVWQCFMKISLSASSLNTCPQPACNCWIVRGMNCSWTKQVFLPQTYADQ